MLKYICISDLHAGARTSLLEKLDGDARGQISPLAKDVATAMDGFLCAAAADAPTKPQLILLGDMLDLQFSDRSLSFAVAAQFLKALQETGHLADEVIATAGNHDHALWTDARLSLEAAAIAKSNNLPAYRDATPAFSPLTSADSRLTSALMDAAGFGSVDFRYPNIGFANKERTVVLHHGHFVESEYKLMTRIKDALHDRPRDRVSAREIAGENAGWIDFFWSTVGDAGFGPDAERLYQNMLTTTGFRRLSAGWARKMAAAVLEMLPVAKNIGNRDLARRAAQVVLDASLGAFRDRERYAEVDSLTTGAREGMKWYINNPVRQQIEDELATQTDDLTFIFGHTHKPFTERIAVKGQPTPVKVYNSGGWTLNGPRLDNAEGASMILIDEALNVASVRLFSTPRNGVVQPAHIEMLNDHTKGSDALADAIGRWLEKSGAAWERVARSAEAAYTERQAYLLRLSAGGHQPEPRRFAAE